MKAVTTILLTVFSWPCLRCTRRGKPLPVTVKVPRWITVSPCKYNKPSSARLLFSLFPAPALAAGNFRPLLLYPSPSSPEDLVSPGQGRRVQAPNPRAKSPPHGGLMPNSPLLSPGALGVLARSSPSCLLHPYRSVMGAQAREEPPRAGSCCTAPKAPGRVPPSSIRAKFVLSKRCPLAVRAAHFSRLQHRLRARLPGCARLRFRVLDCVRASGT